MCNVFTIIYLLYIFVSNNHLDLQQNRHTGKPSKHQANFNNHVQQISPSCLSNSFQILEVFRHHSAQGRLPCFAANAGGTDCSVAFCSEYWNRGTLPSDKPTEGGFRDLGIQRYMGHYIGTPSKALNMVMGHLL